MFEILELFCSFLPKQESEASAAGPVLLRGGIAPRFHRGAIAPPINLALAGLQGRGVRRNGTHGATAAKLCLKKECARESGVSPPHGSLKAASAAARVCLHPQHLQMHLSLAVCITDPRTVGWERP